MAKLSREEEGRLARAWQQDNDAKARETLMGAFKHLVFGAVRDYANKGVPIADLQQEGWIGMMRAIEDFDADRACFSTYATWWIREKMRMAVFDQSGTIEPSIGIQKKIQQFNRLRIRLNHEPSKNEVVSELGLTDKRYDDLIAGYRARRTVKTIDLTIFDGKRGNVCPRVWSALESLSPNQRYVLEMMGEDRDWSWIAQSRKDEEWTPFVVSLLWKGGRKAFRKAYEEVV